MKRLIKFVVLAALLGFACAGVFHVIGLYEDNCPEGCTIQPDIKIELPASYPGYIWETVKSYYYKLFPETPPVESPTTFPQKTQNAVEPSTGAVSSHAITFGQNYKARGVELNATHQFDTVGTASSFALALYYVPDEALSVTLNCSSMSPPSVFTDTKEKIAAKACDTGVVTFSMPR